MTDVAERTELITSGPAEALAGLLGVPGPDPGAGQGLPLLWHCVYLLDRPPQAALGADGHRARGGIPAPPGPGRRRMFAGGRVPPHPPPPPRAAAPPRTPEAGPAQARVPAGPVPAAPRDWPVAVARVLLFRFSALTYTSHRIHYARDYARQVEGYPGLVVHGPLQALLMAELARRVTSLPVSCEYSFRLDAPLFEGHGLIVSAAVSADMTHMMTRDADGRQTAAGTIGPARA